MVRRILAAGDIAKIYNLIKSIVSIFGAELPADILGPAANMHKLKWSRRLEQVAFEYTESGKHKDGNIIESIHYKEHIGFYWMGDLLQMVKGGLGYLNIPQFDEVKDALKDVLKYIEVIVIIVWMLAAAPKSLPLVEGTHYGPVEALFAERYEIGCWSNPILSVCFLDPLPYRKHPFEVGPACTACSTHCEFWEEFDKTIEEGDLCVPPIPHQEKMMETVTESMMDETGSACWAFAIILPLIFYGLKN